MISIVGCSWCCWFAVAVVWELGVVVVGICSFDFEEKISFDEVVPLPLLRLLPPLVVELG